MRRFRSLINVPGVGIVLMSFAIKRVGFASLGFIFQYASEILNRHLANTFLLRIVHQSSVAILFVFVLPILTKALSSPMKDVWVIRSSLISLATGFYVVWTARKLLVLSLGRLKPHEKAIGLPLLRLGNLRSW